MLHGIPVWTVYRGMVYRSICKSAIVIINAYWSVIYCNSSFVMQTEHQLVHRCAIKFYWWVLRFSWLVIQQSAIKHSIWLMTIITTRNYLFIYYWCIFIVLWLKYLFTYFKIYRYTGMTVFILLVYYRQTFPIPCNTRLRRWGGILGERPASTLYTR